jgi:hypothetical protein
MNTPDRVVAVLLCCCSCYGAACFGRFVRDRFRLAPQPAWSRLLAGATIAGLAAALCRSPAGTPACFPVACLLAAWFLLGLFSSGRI